MNRCRRAVATLTLAAFLLCIPLRAGTDKLQPFYDALGLKTPDQIATFVTAAAYTAGFAFAVGAIAKFKAHKDNPTQEPISKPIALLFVAAALIFAPTIFRSIGGTTFGDGGSIAGVEGITELFRNAPPLSPDERSAAAGALTSRLLEEDPKPENMASLKNALQFLAMAPGPKGETAMARAKSVMLGALIGLRHQDNHLNIDEKAQVFALVGRSLIGNLDEAGAVSLQVTDAVTLLVSESVGQLDEMGYSQAEQIALCGDLVKGAVEGLGDAGLSTEKRLSALQGMVKSAILSLRASGVDNEQLPSAVRDLVDGAFAGAFAMPLSAAQYVRVAQSILLGAAGGMETPAPAPARKGARSVASAATPKLDNATALATIKELTESLRAAGGTLDARGEALAKRVFDGGNLSLVEMFELQMQMNKMSQTAEMSAALMSALNQAILSMARNVKN